MRYKSITKIITLVLLVSFIIRFCFIFTHLKHNCTHEDNCPICILIHKFASELDGIEPSLSTIIIAIMFIFFTMNYFLNSRFFDKKKGTLIGLKVELIN